MDLADTNYIVPATGVAPGTRSPSIYPAQVGPFFPAFGYDDIRRFGRWRAQQSRQLSRGGDLATVGRRCRGSPRTLSIVFGYSQSAVVASLVKGDLIDDPGDSAGGHRVFFIAEPHAAQRRHPGARVRGLTIPIIGITFYGPPQNSCQTRVDRRRLASTTVDVAQQYDFLGGDAPARLDPLAFANSIAAYALLARKHAEPDNHRRR